MLLADLVANLLKEPEQKDVTCQRCKKRPRATNKKRGYLLQYCTECIREMNKKYYKK